MTQNLLIQEISPSVQKNLKQLDLQLKSIHPLNVSKILELESEIRQYASHQQSEYFKKGLETKPYFNTCPSSYPLSFNYTLSRIFS